MLAFIDESGDSGFQSHSSDYLILSMVIFKSNESAQLVDKKISEFRSKYSRQELKFSSCSNTVKDQFFDILPLGKFDIRVVVISKKFFDIRFCDEPLGLTKTKSIYNLGLSNLLLSYPLSGAEILLDKQPYSGILKFLKMQKNIMNENNPGMIKKYGMRDSKQSNLIQLADMIVGAVARSYYPQKSNYGRWRKQLNLKESDIIEI